MAFSPQLSFELTEPLPPLPVELRRVSHRSYQICISGEPRYAGRTFKRSEIDERLRVLRRNYTVVIRQTDAR
jgi:hypothetical protein